MFDQAIIFYFKLKIWVIKNDPLLSTKSKIESHKRGYKAIALCLYFVLFRGGETCRCIELDQSTISARGVVSIDITTTLFHLMCRVEKVPGISP